jgi:hypothetical protein
MIDDKVDSQKYIQAIKDRRIKLLRLCASCGCIGEPICNRCYIRKTLNGENHEEKSY